MMPQKRNVYMLEHVKGMAAAPMGALMAATMAMHAAPFSNSIAVGTEGVKPVWAAASQMAEALTLVRLIVAGAEPNQGAMRLRAISGHALPGAFSVVAATEIAQVNLPVAVLIWLMIVPMLLKIDFGALGQVREHWRGIGVTLFINWAVTACTALAIQRICKASMAMPPRPTI